MSDDDEADGRGVTTTHDPKGGGRPRLIFSSGGQATLKYDGTMDGPADFDLLPGVTLIGSGPKCDLRLEGLSERQVEIRRDDADEYVFVALDLAGCSINGGRVDQVALHTGDRLQLGPWVLSFYREEFADHGRPHGGRQGGEGSHQESQPDRREQGITTAGGE